MNDIQSLSATAMALGFLPLACTNLYGRFGRPATTQIQAGGCTGVTRALKWFESTQLVPVYGKHRAMRMIASINAHLHLFPVLMVLVALCHLATFEILCAGLLTWLILIRYVPRFELSGRMKRRVKWRKLRTQQRDAARAALTHTH
jgi:hypothetical protein